MILFNEAGVVVSVLFCLDFFRRGVCSGSFKEDVSMRGVFGFFVQGVLIGNRRNMLSWSAVAARRAVAPETPYKPGGRQPPDPPLPSRESPPPRPPRQRAPPPGHPGKN